MEQEGYNWKKVIIFRIIVFLVLTLNMIKYLYLDLPDIEKKLREKNIKEKWFKIWVRSLVVGKAFETFLSGYVYYFSFSAFISMIISDRNNINKIRQLFRLINN